MSHAFGQLVRLGVDQTQSVERFGVGIGKEGILDVVPLGKLGQDFRRVVAQGGQSQPLVTKFLLGTLQLNQLLFAERSPVG